MMVDGDYIPEVPEAIRTASEGGYLVFFIGAGVSRIIGCPSWKQYADKLIDSLQKDTLVDFDDAEYLKSLGPRESLTIVKRMYRKADRKPTVSARSRLSTNSQDRAIFLNLYQCGARFITTNWDDYFYQAVKELPEFKEHRNRLITSIDGSAYSALNEPGNIIHIHGHVDNEGQMIESLDDYLLAYKEGSPLDGFLNHVFGKYATLFVGYGLDELEILDLVFRNRSTAGTRKSFLLWASKDRTARFTDLHQNHYDEIGVELVPYPVWQNGYGQLTKVLREWSDRLVAAQTEFFKKAELIDEVI